MRVIPRVRMTDEELWYVKKKLKNLLSLIKIMQFPKRQRRMHIIFWQRYVVGWLKNHRSMISREDIPIDCFSRAYDENCSNCNEKKCFFLLSVKMLQRCDLKNMIKET